MGSFQWMFQVVSSVIPLDDVMLVQEEDCEDCTYPLPGGCTEKNQVDFIIHSYLYKGTVHI